MTAMAIEREIEDARSTRGAGTNGKRKEDKPSSSLGKKHKTAMPRGPQGQAAAIEAKARPRLLVSQDR